MLVAGSYTYLAINNVIKNNEENIEKQSKDLQSNNVEEIEQNVIEQNLEDETTTEEEIIEMESIVQGFRDIDLPDGKHRIKVNVKEYTVELINYYDDVVYSENIELGDDTTEYKTLVVKYHKNLTVNEGVTLTAKQVDKLTYKMGMEIV